MSNDNEKGSNKGSSFFDLETKQTRKKKTKELGLVVDKEVTELEFLVCPICCMSKPLKRSGAWSRRKAKQNFHKKLQKDEDMFLVEDKMSARRRHYNPNAEVRFDLFNVEDSPIISIREARGGKGGFKEVRVIPLASLGSASDDKSGKYLEIVGQLRAKCLEIVEEIDKNYHLIQKE